jgi:hypothetical protein
MIRLAELHPLPLIRTETAPQPAELTPTRHSLRQAIARCDRARREAEAAAMVVGRLNAIVDEHSRLQAELHELYVRDERARGEWIEPAASGWIRAIPPTRNCSVTRSPAWLTSSRRPGACCRPRKSCTGMQS